MGRASTVGAKGSLKRGESEQRCRDRNGCRIIRAVSYQVWLEQMVCSKRSSRHSHEDRNPKCQPPPGLSPWHSGITMSHSDSCGGEGQNPERRSWMEASGSGPQRNIWEGAEGLAWAEAISNFFPGYSQLCQL